MEFFFSFFFNTESLHIAQDGLKLLMLLSVSSVLCWNEGRNVPPSQLNFSITHYFNGKMRPVETIPGMWEGRINENDGGVVN
jgi:hypothetical protein